MCQLLGMNCNVPHDIMFSFTGLSTRADEHKDGFGVVFFEGKGARSFMDVQSARDSPVAKLLQTYAIKSNNVIAHIRKATQGHIALENTHPFIRELWGRNWVFAHNGDLKNFHPQLHSTFHPVGDTDSERAFCWLLQEISKSHAGVPTTRELTLTLRELASKIARFGTFNFLLDNGLALWAHCSTNLYHLIREHPFRAATLQDEDLKVDFQSLTTPFDRVAIVATAPLTRDEVWTRMAPGELQVFVDGDRVAPVDLGTA